MIRISKLTDYSMLIMTEMARLPERVLSASFLAERLGLSAATVSKILKILTEANLLHSIRGSEGGYHLAREAREITLAEVIIAMEGGFALTECCELSELCSIDSSCGMKDNWLKINKMIHSMLSGFTVFDMLSPLKLKNTLEGVTGE